MIVFFAYLILFSLIGAIFSTALSVRGMIKFIGGYPALKNPETKKNTKEIVKEYRDTPSGFALQIFFNMARATLLVSCVGLVVAVVVALVS